MARSKPAFRQETVLTTCTRPLLTTAAGTVTPAHVFIVGVGVAGLQAIATARKLGAVVEAYDVRPAVKEQVQSVGAKFVELPLETAGAEYRLEPIYETPNAKELFFIFKDATSGTDTYPAGRFLYSPLPANGSVTLDFNKAYNPPCAFTPFATCPLPPKQNELRVRIEADRDGGDADSKEQLDA